MSSGLPNPYRKILDGAFVGAGFVAVVLFCASVAVFAASAWGSLQQVSSGGTVSSSAWNDLVSHVNTIASQISVSGGNVGVGISSPSEKIDVAGSGKFSGVLSAGKIHPLDVVTEGTACSPNGIIATNSSSSPVVCKASLWEIVGSSGSASGPWTVAKANGTSSLSIGTHKACFLTTHHESSFNSYCSVARNATTGIWGISAYSSSAETSNCSAMCLD